MVGFMRFFKAKKNRPHLPRPPVRCWYSGQTILNETLITLAKLFSSLFAYCILPCTRTNTFFSSDKHTYSAMLARSTPEGYNTGRCGQIELNVPVHKLVVALCAENRWKKGSGTLGRIFPTRRSRCSRYKYRGNSISSKGVCG